MNEHQEDREILGTTVIDLYMRDVRRVYVKLDMMERARIAQLYRNTKDLSYRDQLVHSALRWVMKLASQYARKYDCYFLYADLIQEGNLGLMRAAELFEPSRGFSFSTYATFWIRHRIGRFILDHLTTVRLPVRIHEKLSRLRKAMRKLEQQLERKPTDSEIVEAGFDAKELERLRRKLPGDSISMLSLDQEFEFGKDGDSRTLKDVIPDPRQLEEFLGHVESSQLQEKILSFLRDRCKTREVEIISARYGLDGGGSHTLQEVGDQFGLSRQRIEQILKQRVVRNTALRWFLMKECGVCVDAAPRRRSLRRQLAVAGIRSEEDIKQTLKDRSEKIKKVIAATEKAYGLGPGTLLRKSQKRMISRARQVAMYLSQRLTEATDRELAFLFEITQTTVQYSVNRARKQCEESLLMRGVVDEIQETVSTAS